jgi:hypothetical protein
MEERLVYNLIHKLWVKAEICFSASIEQLTIDIHVPTAHYPISIQFDDRDDFMKTIDILNKSYAKYE